MVVKYITNIVISFLPINNLVDVVKNIFIGALKPIFLHSPGSKDNGPSRSPA